MLGECQSALLLLSSVIRHSHSHKSAALWFSTGPRDTQPHPNHNHTQNLLSHKKHTTRFSETLNELEMQTRPRSPL